MSAGELTPLPWTAKMKHRNVIGQLVYQAGEPGSIVTVDLPHNSGQLPAVTHSKLRAVFG